jgi:hypothetical protein
MATPLDHPVLLGLGQFRHVAAAWCGAMVLVMGLGTFFCVRLGARWRRFQKPVQSLAAQHDSGGV